MEEASAAMAAQHQLLIQQHQQQQKLMLLHQRYQQQQQQQQQPSAISRFPSNIDAHLRTPGLRSHLQQQQQQQLQQQQHQLQQQQKQNMTRQGLQTELEMAHQDAWRVCHPDIKRPFANLEDACERLLPYHVVADYEAEEDDKILDSDTTGQVLTRARQWDNNISAKIAEFTATFEKQVLAFNIITRKRAQGEFRSEERLMIEQALLQDEKQLMLELRAEIESREKAGREAAEAKMRMAMAQAEQARVEAQAQARAEMMARAGVGRVDPMRPSVAASQAMNGDENPGAELQGQENIDGMLHGWGNEQREDEDPSEDFLNDENEPEDGEASLQEEDWREAGELDLNAR